MMRIETYTRLSRPTNKAASYGCWLMTTPDWPWTKCEGCEYYFNCLKLEGRRAPYMNKEKEIPSKAKKHIRRARKLVRKTDEIELAERK